MKRITSKNVNRDPVACPWLIEEFIAPQPQFVSDPIPRGASNALEMEAIPFDIEGSEPGHHELPKREFTVYGALYAECQRRVAAPTRM